MTIANEVPTDVRQEVVHQLAEILPQFVTPRMGDGYDWEQKADDLLSNLESKGYAIARFDR